MSRFSKYKYFLSLTSQFYFCGIPFRLDVKPKCELNCLYCFAMARGGRRTNRFLIADINALKRLFDKVDKNKIDSLNTELLSKRIPIHFGGLSDPFDSEESIKISKVYLKILSERNYPTILSTKNTDAILKDDIFDILKNHRKLIIQISFIGFSQELIKNIEPNIPTTKNRIEAISFLKKNNIPVIARLQPIILPFIDDIKDNLIPALNEAKIDHLITEHLKLPVEKNSSLIKKFIKEINIDLYELYKNLGAKVIGREWILPNEFKIKNIKKIISKLDKDITHSYADYGMQHLGDTYCCCGIDKIWSDVNWFKGNIVNIIKENIYKNELNINLIDDYDYPTRNILYILNSNCRIKDLYTCKDFIKNKWNNPKTVNAPCHLIDIKFYKNIDNNCVYKKI